MGEKFKKLAKQIYATATRLGWHNEKEKKSNDLWMCLVMTEIAEAVEADRKGTYGHTLEYKAEYSRHIEAEEDEILWRDYYENHIKPSREAEMADVVIRLLDFAYTAFGDSMNWEKVSIEPVPDKDFPDIAYYFVKELLYPNPNAIFTCLRFMYEWAARLDFDLDWHIRMKMMFNATRPYKHGGKKY